MAIDTCVNCGDYVDEDYHPEVYREEFNYVCLCDDCYEQWLDTLPEEE